MSDESVKTVQQNNMFYHMISNKKFKTITIIMKLKANLHRDDITKRALMPYILKQGTENYPSEKLLMRKLDELYGAILQIDCMKKGLNHIIHVQLEFANQRFINNDEPIIKEALQLLQQILFHPFTENGAFPKLVVEAEKRKLANRINSLVDNKISYANQRLIDEMYEDGGYAIHKDGYVEDLTLINEQVLFDYYKKMLREDQFDIYILGDFKIVDMEEQITQYLKREKWKEQKPITTVKGDDKKEPKKINETQNIQQAKLHCGYRTNCVFRDDNYAALQVFNGIFGGYPSSRLFMHVRERNSLAYYIASRIESHQGLMFVYSGIEASDAQKTLQIIKQQLDSIQAGNFTDDELDEVKELILSSLKETLDHPSGTIELYYQQVVGRKELSPKQLMENIAAVTKEEVIITARQIELDTIYLLANESGVL